MIEKSLIHSIFLTIYLAILTPLLSMAQINDISIVGTYAIEDQTVLGGDIISFDNGQNIYYLARVPGDNNLFGVVEETPVVVFRTGGGKTPVVREGEVLVNVTTLGGDIAVGDYVTSSVIPGKGQRFEGEDGNVVGIALEPFNEESGTTTLSFDGKNIYIGTIPVLLVVGPYLDGFVRVPAPAIIVNEERDPNQFSLSAFFRYLLAILFAIVSLYLVLKHFGPNLREGVISMGRNPLAKASIQAIVTFNVLLILVISIASLLISLAIIIYPL